MTINDLLGSGIVIQGEIRVVMFSDALPAPIVLFEGANIEWACGLDEKWADCAIRYIYQKDSCTVFEL